MSDCMCFWRLLHILLGGKRRHGNQARLPRREKAGCHVSFLNADDKVCGLCSLPASVPCSVAPEKSVCRPQPPQVRRTFSLDTILSSYLLGQWPRDADGAFTCCTNDKATQVMQITPEGIRMGWEGWLKRPLVSYPPH